MTGKAGLCREGRQSKAEKGVGFFGAAGRKPAPGAPIEPAAAQGRISVVSGSRPPTVSAA